MERRSSAAGDAVPVSNQASCIVHGRVRKRQRSNPGPDTAPYDDMFSCGSWRYSPVSDPDIDYNMQSSKRYLSEVMANNLTRHMSLRHSSSAGAAPPPTTGDDMLGQAHPPSLLQLPPSPHPFAQPHTAMHLYGPGPLTPPGGCSPQRTCISEMSDGLADPGGEILQPANTSDASISISMSHGGGGPGLLCGKTSVTPTRESVSETADSELLDERERSVSLSGMLWGPGSGTATAGFVLASSSAAAGMGVSAPFDGSGNVRSPLPPGAASGTASAHCGINATGPGVFGVSPFFSQGGLPRRISDAIQCPTPAGLARALQQQQPQVTTMMRGPYPRGYMAGGRGLLADIPTSPSDTRFGGLDLRKTALLRSISRRAEETTSDGGAAAATFSTPIGGVGVVPDSIVPECITGVGVCAATVAAMGPVATRCSRAERFDGSGVERGQSAVSCSDSGFSDGMSEGGNGSGGGTGGATGMELSSNSADFGGGGGAAVTVLEEHIDQQQQHEQQILLQQLLMQQEGSVQALLPAQPQPHVLLATQQSHLGCVDLSGVSCIDGGGGGTPTSSAFLPAQDCSICSPPAGMGTPLLPPAPPLMRGDRGSVTPPVQPGCL